MEQEKKPFSKKTLIVIITATIIGIIAVTVAVTLSIVNNTNKEVEASAQLDDIQEENSIEEEKEENSKFHIISTDSNDNVEESENNVNGMRFKMTISDFVKKYNTIIRETEDMPELFTIEDSEFSLLASKQGIKTYSFIRYVIGSNRTRYAIGLSVEEKSNKIVEISFSMAYEDFNKFNSQQQAYLLTHNMPQVIRTIDSKLTMNSAYELIKKASTFNPTIYFKDNIVITAQENGEVIMFKVSAISKEKYKEAFNRSSQGQLTDTTDTDTSTTSENYYEHPQEWYDEQERLYADNTPSTTQPSSSSSQSNSNKDSSTSTNSNSSNTSNKTESEYFKVTANINMKQIIENNATAKRVVDNVKEYPTIHISISDGAGDTGLMYGLINPIDYSEGRQSIPDTITRNISTKAGAKVKFTIKMSSSSAESSSDDVVITLLEKEMTFDKTGTYEIE